MTGPECPPTAWAPMPPPSAGEFDSVPVRRARRQERRERVAARRRSWGYPIGVVLTVVALLFGLLQADQQLTARLIWTAEGAQFVTVAQLPDLAGGDIAGRDTAVIAAAATATSGDNGSAQPVPIGSTTGSTTAGSTTGSTTAGSTTAGSTTAGSTTAGSTTAGSTTAGTRLVVVAGGLNRRDGTSIARALLPGLLTPGTQVVSLVYGNAIVDGDIEAKFDDLLDRVRPVQVDFYGSSMGGDVVLNLAARLQRAIDARQQEVGTGSADGDRAGTVTPSLAVLTGLAQPPAPARRAAITVPLDRDAVPPEQMPAPVPTIGVIYLDCTPLSTADVRAANRTRADTLTGLTEALHTDGGAGTRLVAEVVAQRSQWSRPSNGRWGVSVDGGDLRYKIRQVVRDKISNTGISTGLIKDQYGVIRRMDAAEVLGALSTRTSIVYFLPENRSQDATVDVARVEIALRAARVELGLDVTIVPIPGGSHASAERTAEQYLAAMDRLGRPGASTPTTVITGLPD